MMKQNKLDEQWLDEIRQSLADHEEELPADGWEKIAAAMTAAEEVQPKVETEQPQPAVETKQPRIIPLWLRRAAAAVLLGGIGASGIYYFSEQPSSNFPVLTDVEQKPENTTPEISSPEITTPEITPSAATTVSDSTSVQQPKPTPLLAKATQPTKQYTEVKPLDETIEETSSSETEPATSASSETITRTTSETKTEPVSETLPDMRQEEQTILLAMETGSNRKNSIDRPWNIGVRLGRNGSTDFDLGGEEDGLCTSTPGYSNPFPSDSTSQRAMNLPLTRAELPGQRDIVLNSENHLSWSAGISVSKRLAERLSFETGLVYTYLSSDVEMSLSGRQHQQLHYLGIPLKLNVTLTEGAHWQFYTSAGMMLEHSLFGKRGSTNLHLNDWQWSINGGLGLQYKFSHHMGLYIEPGVNYYFSNGSEVPSLRTESPFSVNLQIGVRWDL